MSKQVTYCVLGILVAGVVVAIWKDRETNSHRPRIVEAERAVHLKSPPTGATRGQEVRPMQKRDGRIVVNAGAVPFYPTDPLSREKADVEMAYGVVLKRLNLSADQRRQLEALLSERLRTAIDARIVGSERKIPHADVNKVVAELERENDEKIKAVLDPVNYESVRKMLDNIPGLSRAAGILGLASESYTVDQLLALSAIFVERSRTNPLSNQIPASAVDSVTGLAEYDRIILAAASRSLSRNQLAALEAYLASARARSIAIYQAQQAVLELIENNRDPAKQP